MSKKYYTENIKKVHDEWKRTYPSFVERRNNEQLASNKLDRSSKLGYHRTNGKVQQRSRFVGPSHITNRRHAHLVRSSMRAARQYPGLTPRKATRCGVERPGDRDLRFTEPTSNKQSTSEQTLKHSGPRYASNGRASKAISQ